MKITTISKVASLVISSVMIQTAVAGHDVGIGVGPYFGGGDSGADIFEMLFGGGGFHSAPAFSGGARFSFGARPTFGQPVIVRSPSRIRTSLGRLTILCTSAIQSHPLIVSRRRTRVLKSPHASNSRANGQEITFSRDKVPVCIAIGPGTLGTPLEHELFVAA